MSIFLFARKECKYSKQFIALIDKYWRHNDIQTVIIDELELEDVPDYIDQTPSILIVNEDEECDLFAGQVAFDWLYKSVISLYSEINMLKTSKTDADEAPKQSILGEFSKKDKKNFEAPKEDVMKLFEERSSDYSV